MRTVLYDTGRFYEPELCPDLGLNFENKATAEIDPACKGLGSRLAEDGTEFADQFSCERKDCPLIGSIVASAAFIKELEI